MNFIKDNLLHLRQHSLSVKGDERVVVHGTIQICGNFHRLLPTNLSKPLSSAFIASPDNYSQTCFILHVGGLKLEMNHTMTLHPSLEVAAMVAENHDFSISINTKDAKYIILKLQDLQSFNMWHQSFCEAISEMIFTNAFLYNQAGCLSVAKLEVAMRRASRLIPANNCHLLRAKRLWNIKMELLEILQRLEVDMTCLTKEHVGNFLQSSEVDRLIVEDADFVRLKKLEPQLMWSLPASMMTEDLTNVSLTDASHASNLYSKLPESVTASKPRAYESQYLPGNIRIAHGTNHRATPIINESCNTFEESDLHWEICSPERLPGKIKNSDDKKMTDKATTTEDLIDPLDGIVTTAEKSKSDVYKQIDEIIDLLSEFSPSQSSASSKSKSREHAAEQSISMVYNVSPEPITFGQSANSSIDQNRKSVFETMDEVVDKFLYSCNQHSMVSRIENDIDKSVIEIVNEMKNSTTDTPIMNSLLRFEQDEIKVKEDMRINKEQSSFPFDVDKVLGNCAFPISNGSQLDTKGPSFNAYELADTSWGENCNVGDADKYQRREGPILQSLIQSPILPLSNSTYSDTLNLSTSSALSPTPVLTSGGKKRQQTSLRYDSPWATFGDKENLFHDNLPSAFREQNYEKKCAKADSDTKPLDTSCTHGNSFFAPDHSFSFHNITTSTSSGEEQDVIEEAELSNMEEQEDKQLRLDNLRHLNSPTNASYGMRKCSPGSISLSRNSNTSSQPNTLQTSSRITIARAIPGGTIKYQLQTFLLIFAILLCGIVVLRDINDVVNKQVSNAIRQAEIVEKHIIYEVKMLNLTSPCNVQDITLLSILSSKAHPIAQRTKTMLASELTTLAGSSVRHAIEAAALKLVAILKFSLKAVLRAMTLMPKKHTDILLSW